jgi:hypothetical protein
MELTLSEEPRIHADQLEKEYYENLPPEEREEQIETNTFVDNLTKVIVLCRESLTANKLSQLDVIVRDHLEVIDGALDQYYTRRQLEEVPRLVQRTLRLSHLNSRDTPSKQTNRYLAEATRAFIMGLPLASIALSRAALEQGLKEKLGRQGRKDYICFEALSDLAEQKQAISSAGAKVARDLARRCNRVLHQEPVKSHESAFEVLTAIRSILEEMFADRAVKA